MQTTEKLYRAAVGGKEIGEYTIADLKAFWRNGTLDRHAMYFHEGANSWKPIAPLIGPGEERWVAAAAPRLSDRSRGIYIILGLFLGGLGVHNFYAGLLGRGAVQLVLTLLGFVLLFPWLIVFIWVVIELFAQKHDGTGARFA